MKYITLCIALYTMSKRQSTEKNSPLSKETILQTFSQNEWIRCVLKLYCIIIVSNMVWPCCRIRFTSQLSELAEGFQNEYKEIKPYKIIMKNYKSQNQNRVMFECVI